PAGRARACVAPVSRSSVDYSPCDQCDARSARLCLAPPKRLPAGFASQTPVSWMFTKYPGNRTGMKLHAQGAIYRPEDLACQAPTSFPNLLLNNHPTGGVFGVVARRARRLSSTSAIRISGNDGR